MPLIPEGTERKCSVMFKSKLRKLTQRYAFVCVQYTHRKVQSTVSVISIFIKTALNAVCFTTASKLASGDECLHISLHLCTFLAILLSFLPHTKHKLQEGGGNHYYHPLSSLTFITHFHHSLSSPHSLLQYICYTEDLFRSCLLIRHGYPRR
jgi:hypothetical protein